MFCVIRINDFINQRTVICFNLNTLEDKRKKISFVLNNAINEINIAGD